MKHFIRILFLFSISTHISHAQILKGRITTSSGDPVSYSTVYIQELRQGTTSNTKGDYEIRLPAGKYSVVYQSLGYQPVYTTITLTDKTVSKDIILPLQYYEIPEVRITASGEDPAYIIMRKAVGMAPYYLNNISSYKAEVYLKGNLVVNKIPKLIQRSMKIEAKKESESGNKSTVIKEGDSYLMESFNEIEFTAPDKYIQKVISINSTFPEEGNEISPMDFIQASFYQPVLAEIAVSPLSPQAFSYYNFKYLGASPQGNYVINKIQVIPKRKSQQVFEGTIYIIEDLWCLHSIDLSNENLFGNVKIQQVYIPVQNDIWMPVSHKFAIKVGIMGFKADVGYSGSVKYQEVTPNLALRKPKSISTDYSARTENMSGVSDTAVSKSKKQIEKILEKDQLTNRDMVKLARLMEKESEKTIPDGTRKNLEIKDKTTHIIEKDAAKKDSAYWTQIRPVPLSDIEKRSLRINDSIKAESGLRKLSSDTTNKAVKKEKSRFLKTVNNAAFGRTWSDTTGFSFNYGGLINMKSLSFNPVDGFVYGINFRLTKRWKNNKILSLVPDIRYAFSRDHLIWTTTASYIFNGMKQRIISIRAGITSKDIGNGGSINTLLNSVTSLFFKKNYLKLYESRYLALAYRTEIANGLILDLSSTYEDRRILVNSTNYSFFNTSKEYNENLPVNKYLDAGSNPVNTIRSQRHADFKALISYTPFQRYRIYRNTKVPGDSDWPTFNLTIQHGINEFSEMSDRYRQYNMLKFEVSDKRDVGAFSEFRWRVSTGGYLDNRNLTFYDFFHFNPQPLPLLLNDYEDVFMIPSFYTLSTPEFYGEVHMKYTTPYLLLKLLPGLSNTLMRENISVSYLGSRYHKNYTELGYSISEFLLIGEVGIYVGFEDIKYRSAGAKLILKFN